MSQATQNFVDRCKYLFKEADKDNTGSLTITEFRNLIRDLTPLADSAIAEIFRDMDDDSDKQLTWDEFKEVCMAKDPKAVQESELRECFKKFDADGSGFLDAAELESAFKASGVKGDVGKNLENADKNQDGKINCEEFIASWKENS